MYDGYFLFWLGIFDAEIVQSNTKVRSRKELKEKAKTFSQDKLDLIAKTAA